MTSDDIEQAFSNALAGIAALSGVTIAWPNDRTDLSEIRQPLLLVTMTEDDPQHVGFPHQHAMTGRFIVWVCVPLGDFTRDLATYVDAIVQEFDPPRSLSAGAGTVSVTHQPSVVRQGREDDLGAWRRDVHVRYRAFN